jgi:hypothetical protein
MTSYLRKIHTLICINTNKWNQIQPGNKIKLYESYLSNGESFDGLSLRASEELYDQSIHVLKSSPFTKNAWDTFIRLNPHIQNNDIKRYIPYIIEKFSIEVTEYILDNNIITIEEATEIMIYNIKNSHMPFQKRKQLIEILCKRGANLNIQGYEGITILHKLCNDIGEMYIYNNGNYVEHQERFDDVLELTRYVLENGADPLLEDKEGLNSFDNFKFQMTPLTQTQQNNFLNLLKIWS